MFQWFLQAKRHIFLLQECFSVNSSVFLKGYYFSSTVVYNNTCSVGSLLLLHMNVSSNNKQEPLVWFVNIEVITIEPYWFPSPFYYTFLCVYISLTAELGSFPINIFSEHAMLFVALYVYARFLGRVLSSIGPCFPSSSLEFVSPEIF